MKLGFLYAGQGSQHAGMGADLYQAYPEFAAVLDAAPVDFDIKEVCFEDSQGLINRTRFTQPCMVAFAAGLTAVLANQGVQPAAVAGLSLGEYSALHAAGVWDAATAIATVDFRGQAMERAAQGIDSQMVAVMGLSREELAQVCAEAAQGQVAAVANCNCPGQVVIGGHAAAVERAVALAKERGARRCIPLKVSGPFHTPLMAPAAQELEGLFAGVDFAEPQVPVLFNCLGGENTQNDPIDRLLVRQVQGSVFLEEDIRAMADLGVEAIVEIGPGKALSGFVKKTVPGLPVYAVETVADVEGLGQWLDSLQEKEGE